MSDAPPVNTPQKASAAVRIAKVAKPCPSWNPLVVHFPYARSPSQNSTTGSRNRSRGPPLSCEETALFMQPRAERKRKQSRSMSKNIKLVGLDVHAATVAIAVVVLCHP